MNKLDQNIPSSSSYTIFYNAFLKFIRPHGKRVFNFNYSFVFKTLTRLRLSFSHLRDQKLGNGFKDTLNPLCFCSTETEITTQYFLNCHI